MKTLKKTLALVLALVMVVGTLSIGALAAEDNLASYDDGAAAKASDYAAAANVSVGLGLIKGYSDKELALDGTLTRDQAAKIAAYLVLGENLATKLPASATVFSDVPTTLWSNAFVAFCASEGIIDGYNGQFAPADSLTGYQFAKVLLLAMNNGFTYKDGEKTGNNYTGNYWETKVAQVANGIGLFADIDESVDLSAPISRGVAMQILFNAVKYDAAQRNSQYNAQYKIVGTDTTDDAGVPTVTYKVGTKTVAVVEATPVATHTGAVSVKTLKADVGLKDKDNAPDIEYIVDGVDGEASDIKNGATVKVFGDKEELLVVANNEYVYTLAKADLVKADAAKDIKAGIMVKGTKYDTNETFAEKDVIVYTINSDSVLSAVVAEKTENVAVTKISGGTYTIGGKGYKVLDGVDTSALTVKKDQTVTIWTDANNLVVKAEVYTEAKTEAPLVYAVVVKTATAGVGGLDASTSYLARLRSFADGTTFDVTISEADYKKVAADDVVTYKTNAKNAALTDLAVVENLATANETLGAKIAVATGINANSKTTYLLGIENSKGEVEYKVVTGYRNVPSIKSVEGVVVADKGVAQYVYVSTSEVSDTKADPTVKNVILALSTASAETVELGVNKDEAFKTYTAVVDAQIVTVKVDADVKAGNFAALKLDADTGVYRELADTAFSAGDKTVAVAPVKANVKYENEVLSAGASYAVASSAKIYLENTNDKTLTALTLEDLATAIEDATVTVYTLNGEAVLVYIVK